MRNEMIRIGQADPRFQELAAEAGQLQDEINNATAAVNAMANDYPELQVGVQALSSVGAAAQGATAAQALLGEENEDVAKSIQKLLAIQSLMNSVQTIANQLSDETALGLRVRAIRQSILTAATEAQTTATAQQTIAQRALNVVMNANPVFLIVTGIVALSAAFVALASDVEEARTEQELLNDAQERSISDVANQTSKLVENTNILKSNTATREQQVAAIEELNKSFPEFLGNLDAEKITTEELNEAIEKQTELINLQAEAKALAAIQADLFKEKLELELEAQQALTDESFRWQDVVGQGNLARETEARNRVNRIAIIEQEIEATQNASEANREEQATLLEGVNAQNSAAAAAQRLNGLQEQQVEVIKAQAAEQDKLRKERQKAHDQYLKELEEEERKLKERTELLEDLLVTNIQDINHRRIVELQQQQKRERQQLIEKYKGDTELLKQLDIKQARELADLQREIREEAEAQVAEENNAAREKENKSKKAALEAELIRMQEDFAAVQQLRIEQAALEREQALQDEELTEGERFLIQQKYEEKKRQIRKESAEKEKALNQEVIQASVSVTEQGISSVSALSDAVFAIKKNNLEKGSAAEEKAARQQFKINKTLQLSGAIIDGVKAINASLAQSPVAIGPVPNPAGIASLAFASATTAANILKIASAKYSSTGGAGVGAPSTPNLSISGGASDAGGAFGEGGETLTGNGGATEQPTLPPVVIVDSEIKASQDRIARVEESSTIR